MEMGLKTGEYIFESCYEKWEATEKNLNLIGPKCKLIWKNLCPFKVEVFVWQAVQERLATGS